MNLQRFFFSSLSSSFFLFFFLLLLLLFLSSFFLFLVGSLDEGVVREKVPGQGQLSVCYDPHGHGADSKTGVLAGAPRFQAGGQNLGSLTDNRGMAVPT